MIQQPIIDTDVEYLRCAWKGLQMLWKNNLFMPETYNYFFVISHDLNNSLVAVISNIIVQNIFLGSPCRSSFCVKFNLYFCTPILKPSPSMKMLSITNFTKH